jgi:nucleotide-binding universal stress UspA family protein
VVSPEVLGSLGQTTGEQTDTFSASYQIAVAARTIREVADLAARARAAGKRLTTLSLDTTITFASPEDRAAFGDELVNAVNALVGKYHRGGADRGRPYRLFLGAHPAHVSRKEKKSR